LKIITALALL